MLARRRRGRVGFAQGIQEQCQKTVTFSDLLCEYLQHTNHSLQQSSQSTGGVNHYHIGNIVLQCSAWYRLLLLPCFNYEYIQLSLWFGWLVVQPIKGIQFATQQRKQLSIQFN